MTTVSHSSATLGWTSKVADGTALYGSTSWTAVTYDAAATTYTRSSPYFAQCAATGSAVCYVFTDCDGHYIYAPETSFTLTESSTVSYCGTDLMFESLGASDALSWVWWADASAVTQDTYYFTSPPASGGSSTPTSSGAPASSSTPSTTSLAPTPSPAPSKSHAGVIAGSVVGGVAIIAATILGVVFLLRRRKHRGNTQDAPISQAPPYAQPYGTDEKPVGVEAGVYGQAEHAQNTYAANRAPPQEIPEMSGSAEAATRPESGVAELPVTKS
ncbi:hypothetical protein K491DRAFT_784955 [Lophiostoma macrostomum CBS 122681]|uniref:Uncharacterized protein n=1 Tax=Lophiostoma macrostomum CBS 122681 TaxID=1314788 RepID=A0A6A6SI10_9PLEO|nr:hypothetical protein K491DRAFT_784955 [Lophiostoma macrostomum CBS 122681]